LRKGAIAINKITRSNMTKKIDESHISDLQYDPRNARKRTIRSSAMIQSSLQEVGASRSIVIDEHNRILAGNGTIEAAGQIGIEKMIIVDADGETIVAVRRSGLTEQQKIKLALFDNRTSDLSEWDADVLAELSQEIDLTGLWSEDELSNLLASQESGEGSGEEDEEKVSALIDEAESGAIESRVSLGQIWKLGRHTIACGDSTSEANIRKLIAIAGCKTPSFVWSDPPYGYEYQSNMRTKTKKFDVLKNDDKILSEFLRPVISATKGWVLVCTSWKVVKEWIDACICLGDPQNIIVWDKGGGGMGDLTHSLLTDYELILAYNRGEEIKGKRVGSVWSIGKDAPSSYLHATQKPVELVQQAFECFTGQSDLIFDPFLGSAPSIIAAQQMEGTRSVIGFELSPEYCEVCLRRFESLTGINAELMGSLTND